MTLALAMFQDPEFAEFREKARVSLKEKQEKHGHY